MGADPVTYVVEPGFSACFGPTTITGEIRLYVEGSYGDPLKGDLLCRGLQAKRDAE